MLGSTKTKQKKRLPVASLLQLSEIYSLRLNNVYISILVFTYIVCIYICCGKVFIYEYVSGAVLYRG